MSTDRPIFSPVRSLTPLSASAPTPAPLASIGPDALRQQLRNANRRASKLKGRQPDAAAVAELQALVGTGPHRRDQLIELLHVLTTPPARCSSATWSPWRPSSSWVWPRWPRWRASSTTSRPCPTAPRCPR